MPQSQSEKLTWLNKNSIDSAPPPGLSPRRIGRDMPLMCPLFANVVILFPFLNGRSRNAHGRAAPNGHGPAGHLPGFNCWYRNKSFERAQLEARGMVQVYFRPPGTAKTGVQQRAKFFFRRVLLISIVYSHRRQLLLATRQIYLRTLNLQLVYSLRRIRHNQK